MVVHAVYATQTGNAKEIARSIHTRLGAQHNLAGDRGRFVSVEDFIPEVVDAPEPGPAPHLAVFVVSTTGDGDAPDSARPFLKVLRRAKKEGKKVLADWKFAMLALGDTNYEEFCGGGKRLEKALVEAGATRLGKRGEADDALGLETYVEPWVEQLWGLLAKETAKGEPESEKKSVHEPPPADQKLKLASLIETAVQMEVAAPGTKPCVGAQIAGHVGSLIHMKPACARLLGRGEDVKTAWHLELQLVDGFPDLDYQPGDAFAVLVPNVCEDVERMIQQLSITEQDASDKVFEVSAAGSSLCPPSTIFEMLTWRCDLSGPPKKTFLRALATHAQDAKDIALLELLCAKEGREEYDRRFAQEQWTLMDLLDEVKSCRPPAQLLLDQLAPLAPRYYSASSAIEMDGKRSLHFAFGMVERLVGPKRASRDGLATGYLGSLCEAARDGKVAGSGAERTIALIQRPSTKFVPPPTLDTPYIMIGPGTGVAPFRGFLRQRICQLRASAGTLRPATTCLYTGNRYRARDYFYGDEIEQYNDNDVVSKLQTAFSRDQAEKRYVQHLLLNDEEELVEMLIDNDNGCRIYVCGDGGGMAKGVNDALIEIISGHRAHSHESAAALLRSWVKEGRYLKDIWFWGDA